VPVILTIDIENDVLYRGNVSDVSELAKSPRPTTSVNQAFLESVAIADIVAVNGDAVKGIRLYHVRALPFRANPASGQPIADVDGSGIFHCIWHILAPDGSWLGSITDRGGSPDPYHIVVGGSGAFLGVTGTHGSMAMAVPQRGASMAEDPANRRIHGGGKSRTVFYLYPRFRPQVESAPGGPLVFHGSDFSLVTAATPAERGETLVLKVAGLGPTKPDLAMVGIKPFLANPLQEVNSPVSIVFNGGELPVLNKIGWPGETQSYRVDFQVPSDASRGMASLRLVAAWIGGPEVRIPIR
jgi:uncharacterized protein (TIGR03437 family)